MVMRETSTFSGFLHMLQRNNFSENERKLICLCGSVLVSRVFLVENIRIAMSVIPS